MRVAYSRLMARLPPPKAPRGSATSFGSLDSNACRQDLLRFGIHRGFALSMSMTDAITAFANEAVCTRPGFNEAFTCRDVRGGVMRDGRLVPVADILDPLACPAVASLYHDQSLMKAASAFLGYRVRRRDARLYWSFAGAMSDGERRLLRQTIDFHYDVPWFNGVYVYFYLTDVSEEAGPHVVYQGSARTKPLRFILSSAFQSDEALAAQYGASRRLVVTGPAGTGFFEDPFGYHKAVAPVGADRLMLQIRYG